MEAIRKLNVLLIEDNDEHATIISRHLKRVEGAQISLARASTLADGLKLLDSHSFDALLLDLRLPDSDIDQTLSRTLAHASELSIIVLSTIEERALARKALHEGAQDYLCKVDLTPELLFRAIEHAIERQSIEKKIRESVRLEQALFNLSQESLVEKKIPLLLNKAVIIVAQALQVEIVQVLELNSKDKLFLLVAGVGWRDGLVGKATLSTATNSEASYILEINKANINRASKNLDPIVVNHFPTETRFLQNQLLKDYQILSGMSVVIHSKDLSEPYGILGAYTRTKRTFNKDEVQFLQSVANVLAAAILRMQLENALIIREELYRLTTDSIPQIVWSCLADGNSDFYNKRWYEFTGVSSGTAWLGSWKKLLHPDDQERVWKYWLHCLKTGEPYESEFRLKHYSGEYRWILGRAIPVKNELGEIIRWMGTCTDIHEKKQVEEALKHSTEELALAVQVRDEFLSIASHELKTPVTSLKLQIEMTRRAVIPEESKAPSPEKLAKVLDVSKVQVKRLTTLIEDLLDVSRIGAGKLSLHFEEVNITALVHQTIELFKEISEKSGCLIHFKFERPVYCVCDSFRMEQVIVNLISNACKYGLGRPVQVSVSQERNFARIEVQDFGLGIPDEKIEKVFERFERAISYHKISGLGLGLYISRQIVRGHQGNIYVKSKLDQGSTFIVEIPLRQEDEIFNSALPQLKLSQK